MSEGIVKHLTDDTFAKEIEKGVTLVDFHAAWCAPCRMLGPVIEEVATHFEKKAKVAKIDIDSEQNTAAQFQVTSVPTMILFKDGKEINRLVGLRDFDAIKSFVAAAL